MKKIVALLLTLTLGIGVFVGCSSNKTENNVNKNNEASTSEETTVDSLTRIQDAGKIIIGVDDSYPPMEYRDDDNKLVGFDVDLAAALGEKLGVEMEFQTTAWDGILLALQSSKFDMILSSLSITDERKESIGFTDAYILGGQILVTLKDSGIEKEEDLKDKVLGCQMGTTGQEAAEKNLSFIKELKKYDKIPEAIIELKNGRVDAVIMDAQVGGYYLAQDEQGDMFKVLDEMVSEEPIGMGLRQEDVELTEALNKALVELKEDGTLSELSIKWFGYDAYQ
ncbi:amino acid ABC transporter substrate-binding protein [Clostridium grantii]|uniref:Amino acid ABC transporter substrate-binding protein, PAAT family n=1 Tax=Clostridium grantii DSM 8605 TaxID=1121316 RepID=A0A1M5UN25_9CLOT|nr:amino acid ABC transporter substrate-binding protein [Clostridium grantii]SHH64306.1 amino acid ABC transporter substrate-binding protein, PAAT family [Clostridium grantii DSM 8605]